MAERQVKICLNTMVANESHVILRMLESCYRYIDYWVIQDNGSKDDTKELIQNFFDSKKIPGHLYTTPWQFPGYNRDHALQTCLNHNHGCDWILRIDADEKLEIDPSFDWTPVNDTSIQSFNIMAYQGNCAYRRCWLWNSRMPWKFKHDKRHEIIYMDKEGVGEGFQRFDLDAKFRHLVIGDGKTWENTTKFFQDALEIEKDLLADKTMKSDLYHLYYMAKSYRDSFNFPGSTFPFGDIHIKECARRALFYFDRWLDLTHDFSNTRKAKYIDESAYMAFIFKAECFTQLDDYEAELACLQEAEAFCPPRNEHLLRMAKLFYKHGKKKEFLQTTTRLMDPERKNPISVFALFVDNDAYYDTSAQVQAFHETALKLNSTIDASVFKEAFDETGSDKAKAHNYHESYAEMLPSKVNSLLEIGLSFDNNIGRGSLLSWSKIFPNSQIVGADIDQHKFITTNRIKCYWIDQTSENAITAFKNVMIGRKFDIVIDDGTHFFKDSSLTFNILFPLLEDNGVYCIEDIAQQNDTWQQSIDDWTAFLKNRTDLYYEFRNTNKETLNSVICFVSRHPLKK